MKGALNWLKKSHNPYPDDWVEPEHSGRVPVVTCQGHMTIFDRQVLSSTHVYYFTLLFPLQNPSWKKNILISLISIF